MNWFMRIGKTCPDQTGESISGDSVPVHRRTWPLQPIGVSHQSLQMVKDIGATGSTIALPGVN
jgi:hypothetical protein